MTPFSACVPCSVDKIRQTVAAGFYIGDTNDAPGASVMGILLMIGAVALGVRIARRKT